jgi:hypothetical protein
MAHPVGHMHQVLSPQCQSGGRSSTSIPSGIKRLFPHFIHSISHLRSAFSIVITLLKLCLPAIHDSWVWLHQSAFRGSRPSAQVKSWPDFPAGIAYHSFRAVSGFVKPSGKGSVNNVLPRRPHSER